MADQKKKVSFNLEIGILIKGLLWGLLFGVFLSVILYAVDIRDQIPSSATDEMQKMRETFIENYKDSFSFIDDDEITLPEEYKSISCEEKIKLVRTTHTEQPESEISSVVFYLTEDRKELIVYSMDEQDDSIINMFPGCSFFVKLKDNWYYIVV